MIRCRRERRSLEAYWGMGHIRRGCRYAIHHKKQRDEETLYEANNTAYSVATYRAALVELLHAPKRPRRMLRMKTKKRKWRKHAEELDHDEGVRSTGSQYPPDWDEALNLAASHGGNNRLVEEAYGPRHPALCQ